MKLDTEVQEPVVSRGGFENQLIPNSIVCRTVELPIQAAETVYAEFNKYSDLI